MDYIIVQAGGKGTRMEALTRNKPKALVPVNNRPMIMHLFHKYPDKKFIIIADYKYDVFEKYLHAFANVDYKMVCATGGQGTCAGIAEAVSYVPYGERFMIIWCDLILPEEYEIPETNNNVIGISKDFPCRWKYENGIFKEEQSKESGVAGHFIFMDKSYLDGVPSEGEFVRWLKEKEYKFEEQALYKTHEYGLYSEWDKLPKLKCRPFNSIRFEGNKFYKTAIDRQGRELAVREVAWYKKLQDKDFKNIPKIYNYNPLCMERIDGKNIYEYTDLPFEKKKEILKQITSCLEHIHGLGSIKTDEASYKEAYIGKTYARLEKVKELVPFAKDSTININGRECRNIFFHKKETEDLVMQYIPERFSLIHGDCTFSNIMLENNTIPKLIDPRGYFGTTELYGDAAYDWVKLYYSIVSNYDQFNLKRFGLYMDGYKVKLEINSNKWEELENYFFELLEGEVCKKQMKLLLALVWLSLTTYAWEDYDSICGAFYNGLYYLEEALQ